MAGGKTETAIRASHGERDAALCALATHYADGRLDAADFDERADAALAARTRDELILLFADLPDTPDAPLELRTADAAIPAGTASVATATVHRRPARRARTTRPDPRRIALAAALVGLSVLAVLHGHPPVPLIPLLFIMGRRARPWTREAESWN